MYSLIFSEIFLWIVALVYLLMGGYFVYSTMDEITNHLDTDDNIRMAIQMRQPSMLIPLVTLFLFWWVFLTLAKLSAVLQERREDRQRRHTIFQSI